MSDRYVTKKVFVVQIQGNTNGQTTGSEPGRGFHWEVREVATDLKIGPSYLEQAEAENACLKLNYPRS